MRTHSRPANPPWNRIWTSLTTAGAGNCTATNCGEPFNTRQEQASDQMYSSYHHNNALVQGLQYSNGHSASSTLAPILVYCWSQWLSYRVHSSYVRVYVMKWDICMTLFPDTFHLLYHRYIPLLTVNYEIYSVQTTTVCNLHLTTYSLSVQQSSWRNTTRKQAHSQWLLQSLLPGLAMQYEAPCDWT